VAVPRWLRFVRPQDAVWLLLFSALGFASPTRRPSEIALLFCLALLQVLEPRLKISTTSSAVATSVLLKLLLGYLLIAFSGELNSSHYPILLLPVISAASSLGVLGTTLFTLLACASYASFLLFVDWTRYTIPPDQVRELCLRLLFLAVAGYFTNQIAKSGREERRRYQTAAEQLALANQNLQTAEAVARRSERLAALGQLSAGLAHELRNPLGTIRASAEMLKKSVPADNPVALELAGFVATEVDRANSLVTRFLEFARPLEPRLSPCELSDVVDRAVANLDRDGKAAGIAIYKNYSPDIHPLPLDAELMERVFYNLLLNAAQASPPGGTVTIKTRSLEDSVEVSVIDRGAGIQSRDLESIFNPFFTTKPEGVGLGLAIVSKIVDQHGGRITAESEAGKGSIFRVYLPLQPPGAAPKIET
jgi:signal transduction histidine kinase